MPPVAGSHGGAGRARLPAMIKRLPLPARLASALVAMCACHPPAYAQDATTPAAQAPAVAPAVQPRSATIRVVLATTEGPIVLELEKERAPITTANFLRYVDGKRLDGTTFYRSMRVGETGGLIQGGVRDPRQLFPPIKLEPTSRTGLSHDEGAISMARAAPDSARSDFFIVTGGLTGLDADPAKPGDNLGFAAFGHVVEGMDVVRRIQAGAIDPAAGQGAMRGEMLAKPVKLLTARRVRAPGS
jgi:peptidyl-prolyl cis-trans isomerase A (cyclophilin A)